MPKKKITDFRPQEQNANQHTPRGLGMLANSIQRLGWVGAITVAADGEVFDGSARLETVYEKFGEDVEPIYVEATGDRPVIVCRTDIPTAKDPRAKELGILANRTAEVSLNWDLSVLEDLQEEGIAIDEYFRDDELQKIAQNMPSLDDLDGDDEEVKPPVDGEKYPLAIVLSWAELQEWKVIKESAGTKSDRECFLKLMRGDL
jgi:hypothetical protein